MIVAHLLGFPVEESVVQLASAGAALVTTVAIAGRATLDRLRRRQVATPVDPDRPGSSCGGSGSRATRQPR